jgi:flagellar biosynthesis protein FliQ
MFNSSFMWEFYSFTQSINESSLMFLYYTITLLYNLCFIDMYMFVMMDRLSRNM